MNDEKVTSSRAVINSGIIGGLYPIMTSESEITKYFFKSRVSHSHAIYKLHY